MNQSALSSLEEGMEETLTLHRLDLMSTLSTSFRTTNCIENVNSLLQQLTHNVRRWTNSSQRHRWVATAWLDRIELRDVTASVWRVVLVFFS
jgi:transposase-like protein